MDQKTPLPPGHRRRPTWNQISYQKTPWGMASGGGFGNTLETADGTILTAYTYRDASDQTQLEVARWRLP